MKFGAHIFLWIERWTNKELGLIGRAKSLGLDVLEIAVGDDVEYDAKKIRDEAERHGIEIVVSPGGIWPMDADVSLEDKGKAKIGMDFHKYWIAKGAEAGATAYTGALYGHPGRVERREPSVSEFKRVAENLRELAEYAAQYKVNIVLEPMSHFRTHLVNTPEQALRLIEVVNHPNLGLLFDTYHAVTEIRDYYQSVKNVSKKLWGLHACENDRGVPGGGIVPWGQVFRGLNEDNFNGYVILETYNSTIGDFAYTRGMFHNVCPDGDEFVRQGTSFLRDGLGL